MGLLIGKRRQVVTTQVVVTKNSNTSGQASQARTVGGPNPNAKPNSNNNNNNNGNNRDNINITGAIGGNEGAEPLPRDYNYAAETQRPNALATMDLSELARPAGGVERYQGPEIHHAPTNKVAEPTSQQTKVEVVIIGPFPEGNILNKAVNLYGISKALFAMVRLVSDVSQSWSSPEFVSNLSNLFNELKKESSVLCHHPYLKNWVHPLHYRKTGAVLGAGRRIANLIKELEETVKEIEDCEGQGFDGQFGFKESIKELLNNFLLFCNSTEMVTTSDFTLEVNELAKTLRDVVDTSNGKLNYVFDDIARICTTSAIRMCKLGLWKSVQVHNTQWSKQIIDMSITVTRATKVMHIVGAKLYEDQSNQIINQQLSILARGIVTQIKSIQGLTNTEPTQSQTATFITPEIVQEHITQYDTGIREVQQAFNNYINNNAQTDPEVIASINEIMTQLNVIKATVASPNVKSFVAAVTSISDAVESFCASVYFALSLMGDSNEVLKEEIMETMQQCIQCCIHSQLVASSKAMMHLMVNPEITILTALRLLLMSIAIIIDAVGAMKKADEMNLDPNEGAFALTPEDIKAGIVYILHYGRVLFKGEDETEPEPEPVINKPVIINNILYPNGAPEEKVEEESESSSYETVTSEEEPAVNKPTSIPTSTGHQQLKTATSDLKNTNTGNNNNSNNNNNQPNIASPRIGADPGNSTGFTPRDGKQQNVVSNNTNSEGEQKMWPNPLEIPAEIALTMNPDSYNENNLPYGFEKPPCPKPGPRNPTMSNEEYKEYMRNKYEYETWENKLILWRVKLKRRIDECKK